MAKSADLSAYNPILFSVIQQVRDTGSYETTGTMEECMALRFELYGFKRALQRAGHPDALAAKQISWYVQETGTGAKLTGLRKDRTKVVEMAKRGLLDKQQAVWPPAPEGRPPGMELELPKLEQPKALEETDNPMESALRKLGFFTSVEDREKK